MSRVSRFGLCRWAELKKGSGDVKLGDDVFASRCPGRCYLSEVLVQRVTYVDVDADGAGMDLRSAECQSKSFTEGIVRDSTKTVEMVLYNQSTLPLGCLMYSGKYLCTVMFCSAVKFSLALLAVNCR